MGSCCTTAPLGAAHAQRGKHSTSAFPDGPCKPRIGGGVDSDTSMGAPVDTIDSTCTTATGSCSSQFVDMSDDIMSPPSTSTGRMPSKKSNASNSSLASKQVAFATVDEVIYIEALPDDCTRSSEKKKVKLKDWEHFAKRGRVRICIKAWLGKEVWLQIKTELPLRMLFDLYVKHMRDTSGIDLSTMDDIRLIYLADGQVHDVNLEDTSNDVGLEDGDTLLVVRGDGHDVAEVAIV